MPSPMSDRWNWTISDLAEVEWKPARREDVKLEDSPEPETLTDPGWVDHRAGTKWRSVVVVDDDVEREHRTPARPLSRRRLDTDILWQASNTITTIFRPLFFSSDSRPFLQKLTISFFFLLLQMQWMLIVLLLMGLLTGLHKLGTYFPRPDGFSLAQDPNLWHLLLLLLPQIRDSWCVTRLTSGCCHLPSKNSF